MSKQIFFVTGLPRSRTAWLATLLTWGDCFCFHDGLANIESLDELDEKFNSVPGNIVGNSDPANLLFHVELMKRYPEAKWIVVERNLCDAKASCRKAFGPYYSCLDWDSLISNMEHLNPCVAVRFEELNSISALMRIIDCIGVCIPGQRIAELLRLNIQILPLVNVRVVTVEKMRRLKASFNECVLA